MAGPVADVERLVTLEGGTNFRDLGGYRTPDGGRVRWRAVFRSAALHRLTATDRAALVRLGLRVVYDLRGEEERDRAPSMLPDGVRCEVLPIGGSAAKTQELTDLVMEAKLADRGIDVERYRAVFGAPREAMSTFLATLRERYGSVEDYLVGEAGVAPGVLTELRAHLVEVPGA